MSDNPDEDTLVLRRMQALAELTGAEVRLAYHPAPVYAHPDNRTRESRAVMYDSPWHVSIPGHPVFDGGPGSDATYCALTPVEALDAMLDDVMEADPAVRVWRRGT